MANKIRKILEKKKADDILELERSAKIEKEKIPEKIEEKRVRIRRKVERRTVENDKNILRAEIIESIDPDITASESNLNNNQKIY